MKIEMVKIVFMFMFICGVADVSQAGFGGFLKKATDAVNGSVDKVDKVLSPKEKKDSSSMASSSTQKKLNAVLLEAQQKGGVVWMTYLAGGKSDLFSHSYFSEWANHMKVVPLTIDRSEESEYLIKKYGMKHAVNFLLLDDQGRLIGPVGNFTDPADVFEDAGKVLSNYNQDFSKRVISYIPESERPVYEKFNHALSKAKEINGFIWLYYYTEDKSLTAFLSSTTKEWAERANVELLSIQNDDSSTFIRNRYEMAYTQNHLMLDADGNKMEEISFYGDSGADFVYGAEVILLNQRGITSPLNNPTTVDEWYTDYSKACAIAKETGKDLFVKFGNDKFCGFCKAFNNYVLSESSFRDYAKDNLVLVNLDFPGGKTQPAELAIQNSALQNKYKCTSWPTVLLVNPDGVLIEKRVAREFAEEGGLEKALAWLHRSLEQ